VKTLAISCLEASNVHDFSSWVEGIEAGHLLLLHSNTFFEVAKSTGYLV
jgi:hypothetical protein